MASHSSRAPPPPRGKEKEGEGQPPHPSIDPLGQFMQSIKSGLATFVHSETVQHLLPTVSSHHGSFSGSAPPHTGVVHSVGTTYFSFESGHDELERSVLFSGEHQNGSALYLLGKKYGPFTAGENGAQAERNLRLFQAFKRDFASLYRATYRKNFQPLSRAYSDASIVTIDIGHRDQRWGRPRRAAPPKNNKLIPLVYFLNLIPSLVGPYDTDAGWGCMIRVGQMLLANLMRREMLLNAKEGEIAESLVEGLKILRYFLDKPSAKFGLQSFLVLKQAGDWLGPTTVATTMEKLVNHQSSVGAGSTAGTSSGPSAGSRAVVARSSDGGSGATAKSLPAQAANAAAERMQSSSSSSTQQSSSSNVGGTTTGAVAAQDADPIRKRKKENLRGRMSSSYERIPGSFAVYLNYDGCIILDELARLHGGNVEVEEEEGARSDAKGRNGKEPKKKIGEKKISVEDDYLQQSETVVARSVGDDEQNEAIARKNSATKWEKGVLILLPFQHGGLEYMEKEAQKEVAWYLQIPYSMGILSGRPRKAHYFVGCLDHDRLIYLDPHVVQTAALDLRQPRDSQGVLRLPSNPRRLHSPAVFPARTNSLLPRTSSNPSTEQHTTARAGAVAVGSCSAEENQGEAEELQFVLPPGGPRGQGAVGGAQGLFSAFQSVATQGASRLLRHLSEAPTDGGSFLHVGPRAGTGAAGPLRSRTKESVAPVEAAVSRGEGSETKKTCATNNEVGKGGKMLLPPDLNEEGGGVVGMADPLFRTQSDGVSRGLARAEDNRSTTNSSTKQISSITPASSAASPNQRPPNQRSPAPLLSSSLPTVKSFEVDVEKHLHVLPVTELNSSLCLTFYVRSDRELQDLCENYLKRGHPHSRKNYDAPPASSTPTKLRRDPCWVSVEKTRPPGMGLPVSRPQFKQKQTQTKTDMKESLLSSEHDDNESLRASWDEFFAAKSGELGIEKRWVERSGGGSSRGEEEREDGMKASWGGSSVQSSYLEGADLPGTDGSPRSPNSLVVESFVHEVLDLPQGPGPPLQKQGAGSRAGSCGTTTAAAAAGAGSKVPHQREGQKKPRRPLAREGAILESFEVISPKSGTVAALPLLCQNSKESELEGHASVDDGSFGNSFEEIHNASSILDVNNLNSLNTSLENDDAHLVSPFASPPTSCREVDGADASLSPPFVHLDVDFALTGFGGDEPSVTVKPPVVRQAPRRLKVGEKHQRPTPTGGRSRGNDVDAHAPVMLPSGGSRPAEGSITGACAVPFKSQSSPASSKGASLAITRSKEGIVKAGSCSASACTKEKGTSETKKKKPPRARKLSKSKAKAASRMLNWKPVSLPEEFRVKIDEGGKVNYGDMFGVTVEELDAADYEVFGVDGKVKGFGVKAGEGKGGKGKERGVPSATSEDQGADVGSKKLSKSAKKNAKKKLQKRQASVGGGSGSEEGDEKSSPPAMKKAKKTKSSANVQAPAQATSTAGPTSTAAPAPSSPLAPQEIVISDAVADNWAARFPLHESILAGLTRKKFNSPSAIQESCMLPALAGRDIVGVAETGSGKTLAFGLPILHKCLLLSESANSLVGLILVPTRELAQQVKKHFDELLTAPVNGEASRPRVHTCCLVGGLTPIKQLRLLGKRPQIVVGTPGRVAQLSGLTETKGPGRKKQLDEDAPAVETSAFLRSGYRQIEFLVLDEADRLVEAGHFRDLTKILGFLYRERREWEASGTEPGGGAASALENAVEGVVGENEAGPTTKQEKGRAKGAQVQTLVFSATMADLAPLFEKVKFNSKRIANIDLSKQKTAISASSEGGQIGSSTTKFPDTLSLQQLSFPNDGDRDALLCHYVLSEIKAARIMLRNPPTPEQNPPKPKMIVFVNAISMVYRLYSLFGVLLGSDAGRSKLAAVGAPSQLKITTSSHPLKCDVFALHSNMTQKERLNKMDKFRAASGLDNSDAAVLICTDLAARGLDVPDVNFVLHFQVPRSSELFVHRTGRTARAGKAGTAVMLNSPGDHAKYDVILQDVGLTAKKIDSLPVPTAKHLQALRTMMENCSELEKVLHEKNKQNKETEWFRKHSRECELPFSDVESASEEGQENGGGGAGGKRGGGNGKRGGWCEEGYDLNGTKAKERGKLLQLWNQVKQKLGNLMT
eukprot:g12969.t1